MLSKTALSMILAASATACLSAGCAHHSYGSDVSGSEDVAGTESDVESLGTSFIGSDGQSMATQSLAGPSAGIHVQDVTTVGNAGWFFQPAGCIQVTQDTSARTVDYAFDGCTGPLGLVELTGTIHAQYQVAPGQLTVDFSSQDFHVNRATITDWQATAVVTTTGDQRTMTWNAQLSGKTGRGREFSRTNQKTLTWTIGVQCVAVSGQSTGDILGVRLQTSIDSWQRCADSCPQAGSEIQVQNLDNGDSIDIKYQGGATADLTIRGRTDTISLACGD